MLLGHLFSLTGIYSKLVSVVGGGAICSWNQIGTLVHMIKCWVTLPHWAFLCTPGICALHSLENSRGNTIQGCLQLSRWMCFLCFALLAYITDTSCCSRMKMSPPFQKFERYRVQNHVYPCIKLQWNLRYWDHSWIWAKCLNRYFKCKSLIWDGRQVVLIDRWYYKMWWCFGQFPLHVVKPGQARP